MTAYSFKRRFVDPIRVGLGLIPVTPKIEDDDSPQGYCVVAAREPKRQTIRARGKRRHAYVGEELQLYCGMRTKGCFLIGRARCVEVQDIHIAFRDRRRSDWVKVGRQPKIDRPHDLDQFAKRDGFQDWQEQRAFWREEHPGVDDFDGVIVLWDPLP